MNATRALFFDFGGTLDADGEPWKERFHALFRAAGVDVSAEAFAPVYYRADDRITDRADAGASHAANVEELGRAVAAGLGADAATGLRVARRFLEDAQEVIDRNRPVLERLRRRFRIGVISNFYGNLERACRETGLDTLIDAYSDSGVVGVIKPDARLFRHGLDALGVSPEESWMIGDSLHRDMAGAERIGMRRLWLRGPHAEPTSGFDAVVRTLPEVEAVFS